MKPVDLLRALVDASAPDEWFVTDGATSIGPIELELLARGISAGKVPLDAFVRHVTWTGWRGLSSLAEDAPSFNPRQTFRVLPATTVHLIRETLPSIDLEEEARISEIPRYPTQPPPRPVEAPIASPFDGASDLSEALLMLMATVVEQARADAALVYGAREQGAIVVCSHGPRMFEMLGETLPHGDPVVFAARKGLLLFAEPVSGIGGRAIKARLSRLGTTVEAAFMVPVRIAADTDGDKPPQLLALVEVGRTEPFRARDVANAEALVETLVETIQRMGWKK